MTRALEIPQFYFKRMKNKRQTEKEKLKKFANKITKVPNIIHIPSEYLVKFKGSIPTGVKKNV